MYFTSGGSEATETAIKLARQYFLESKQPSRYRVSRAQAELPRQYAWRDVSKRKCCPPRALCADDCRSGATSRRVFAITAHSTKTFPECDLACADDLNTFLRARMAFDCSAAFMFEPVVGATLGRCARRRWLHRAHRGNLP